MQGITQLKPVETVQVDPAQLETLYRDLGTRNAEDVVCRAMEELALRLNQCERLYRRGQMGELHQGARSLCAIADQIGMARLAHVAKDVVCCIEVEDTVALAACMARLVRAGEGSLMAVWDLQDVTI